MYQAHQKHPEHQQHQVIFHDLHLGLFSMTYILRALSVARSFLSNSNKIA